MLISFVALNEGTFTVKVSPFSLISNSKELNISLILFKDNSIPILLFIYCLVISIYIFIVGYFFTYISVNLDVTFIPLSFSFNNLIYLFIAISVISGSKLFS